MTRSFSSAPATDHRAYQLEFNNAGYWLDEDHDVFMLKPLPRYTRAPVQGARRNWAAPATYAAAALSSPLKEADVQLDSNDSNTPTGLMFQRKLVEPSKNRSIFG